MNEFEKMHKRRTKSFTKQILKERVAFELNEFYTNHQGYEKDDKESLFDIDLIFNKAISTPKLTENEKQEILDDAIVLAKINYSIVLKSKDPLLFEEI